MLLALLSSVWLFAAVTCENGVCRLVPDEPSAVVSTGSVPGATGSVPGATGATGSVPGAETPPPDICLPRPARMAEGVMSEREFLAFLRGDRPRTDGDWADRGLVWMILFAVLGGLAMNLTPCVLPMIPVNLMVIGASPKRGLLYGLGQMVTFGALGILAALGGVAFGTIQSSPWFNGAVAVLFATLSLALFGVFALDFTRLRKGLGGGAFVLGAVSAVLAGACVAPVLVSVLLLTARLAAEGHALATALPFAVGLGLALPWPFLGAGLKVLPKPGAWMRWVNRGFAIFLLALAVHYAMLSVRGFRPAAPGTDLTPETFRATVLAQAARDRPLLVFCHADWCHNCPAMERLLSGSPAVRKALEGMDVVRLRIDRPRELSDLPGLSSLSGLPAFLIYPPRP